MSTRRELVMSDVGATRSPASDIILVGMPDGERTADIGRALAAEHLMPVMAFDGEALMRFAADRDFAAVVVDPALDPSNEPATLLETLRAATPAPVVVLGFVPGDGTRAPTAGIGGLLGADAPGPT
jgi:hypothetical protein